MLVSQIFLHVSLILVQVATRLECRLLKDLAVRLVSSC